MAKIVDPDQINDGTEVVYNPNNLTVQYVIAGNLNDDAPGKSSGVTGQAAYSASKDHILASATLRRHRSPYDPVFDASYLIKDGWTFADQQSKDLLRDAGFRVTSTGEELACIIGLQNTASNDQLYYQQVEGFDSAVIDFDKTGDLNELIQIFDGGSNDYRNFLKVYNRIEGKIYSEGNLLVDQDLSALTFIAYRLPLGNSNDPNNDTLDGVIDTTAPYTGMGLSLTKGQGFTTWANSTVYPAESVVLDPLSQANGSVNGTWWFTPGGGTSSGTGTGDDIGVTDWEIFSGERQIGKEWYAFNRIIEGNSGTDIQVHEWAKRQLRLTSDINDDAIGAPNQNGFGVVNGNVARLLTSIVGGMLTQAGVFIDNFDPSSRATAVFQDITVDGGGLDSESVPITTTSRSFPFSAAGNIVFSDNAVQENNADTFYDMYFAYTRRDTNTDFAITSSTANSASLTSGSLDLTSVYSDGDFTAISGFSNEANNGIFQVSSVTSGSMTITKIREPSVTLVDEAAGLSVNIDDNPFNTVDAIIVQDDTGADITGQISQINEPFTFAYDTNTQGGRSPGTDASIVIAAQGLELAKWAEANFVITRAVGLSFPVNLLDESVYNNPA